MRIQSYGVLLLFVCLGALKKQNKSKSSFKVLSHKDTCWTSSPQVLLQRMETRKCSQAKNKTGKTSWVSNIPTLQPSFTHDTSTLKHTDPNGMNTALGATLTTRSSQKFEIAFPAPRENGGLKSGNHIKGLTIGKVVFHTPWLTG